MGPQCRRQPKLSNSSVFWQRRHIRGQPQSIFHTRRRGRRWMLLRLLGLVRRPFRLPGRLFRSLKKPGTHRLLSEVLLGQGLTCFLDLVPLLFLVGDSALSSWTSKSSVSSAFVIWVLYLPASYFPLHFPSLNGMLDLKVEWNLR